MVRIVATALAGLPGRVFFLIFVFLLNLLFSWSPQFLLLLGGGGGGGGADGARVTTFLSCKGTDGARATTFFSVKGSLFGKIFESSCC